MSLSFLNVFGPQTALLMGRYSTEQTHFAEGHSALQTAIRIEAVKVLDATVDSKPGSVVY